MATTIRIKRSNGSTAPASLAFGELAYAFGNKTLYIGKADGSAEVVFSGSDETLANAIEAVENKLGKIATYTEAGELATVTLPADTKVGTSVDAKTLADIQSAAFAAITKVERAASSQDLIEVSTSGTEVSIKLSGVAKAEDLTALEGKVGTETELATLTGTTTVLSKIAALETATGNVQGSEGTDIDVGYADATGVITATLKDGEGTKLKALGDRVGTLETTVGNKTSGLVQEVAAIKADIGTDETANTVKGRIKAIETNVGTKSVATQIEEVVGKDKAGEEAATGLFKEIDDVAASVKTLDGAVVKSVVKASDAYDGLSISEKDASGKVTIGLDLSTVTDRLTAIGNVEKPASVDQAKVEASGELGALESRLAVVEGLTADATTASKAVINDYMDFQDGVDTTYVDFTVTKPANPGTDTTSKFVVTAALKDTGVAAGEYALTTVDAKGRVTAGVAANALDKHLAYASTVSETFTDLELVTKKYVDALSLGYRFVEPVVDVSETLAAAPTTGRVLVLEAGKQGIYVGGQRVEEFNEDTQELAGVTVLVAGGDHKGEVYRSGADKTLADVKFTKVFAPSAVLTELSAGSGLVFTNGAFHVNPGTGIKVENDKVSIDDTVATLTGKQTLTNKTITGAFIGGTTKVTETITAEGENVGLEGFVIDGGTF